MPSRPKPKTKQGRMNVEEFNARWTPEPNTGCWLWTGYVERYGAFRGLKAHRAAWMLYKGDIPQGKRVLHRCDVPSCVNPEHLFLGTLRDNSRDSILKGRNPRAKLDLRQVHEIRLSSDTTRELSKRYGVCISRINRIRRNKAWKPLENTQ